MTQDRKEAAEFTPIEESADTAAFAAAEHWNKKRKMQVYLTVAGGLLSLTVIFLFVLSVSDDAVVQNEAPMVSLPLSAMDTEIRLSEKLSSLAELPAIRLSLENLSADVKAVNFSAELTLLREDFNRQTAAVDQLVQSVAAMGRLISETTAELKKRKTEQPEAEAAAERLLLDARSNVSSLSTLHQGNPPFRVISAETWDGQPTILLEADGKTKSVRAGEWVAGWKIIEINVLARTVTVAPKARLTEYRTLEVGS